jgi:hypothetical protein
MLSHPQDAKDRNWWRVIFLCIVGPAFGVGLVVFAVRHGPLIDRLQRAYPTAAILVTWAIGMLSYHQDAKRHILPAAILSQILAVASLVALIVFGFTQQLWLNLLIAPVLIWLHIQFTRRWWAKPGAWW